MKRRIILILAMVWTLALVAVGSSMLTLALSGEEGQVSRIVSEREYQTIDRYRRLDEVRRTLEENYYVEVDEDELVLGAIRGMMDSLDDPYTFYYTTEEMEESNEDNEGLYHGIGLVVQITPEEQIEIVRVYDGSPAQQAGLQAEDCIVEVDGQAVSGESGKTLSHAVSLIQGEDGTQVHIAVLRDGEKVEFDVTRAEVNVSHVEYSLIGKDIGYVNILQFSGNDVTGFEEALDAFRAANVSGVVLDLRGNPGGMLDHVVAIADQVLPEGLATYIEDRQGNRQEEWLDDEYWDIPMVVMVNDMSASASELFTAAFQDYERGTVVGTTTFGKGIVQTVITFAEDGAGMQLTTACYYSPNGRSIHGTGVDPDVEVELNDGVTISSIAPDPENDNQLAAALNELELLIAEYEPAA